MTKIQNNIHLDSINPNMMQEVLNKFKNCKEYKNYQNIMQEALNKFKNCKELSNPINNIIDNINEEQNSFYENINNSLQHIELEL